ncbi:hypothetical protein [Actinoallomurus acaciae]|uniref:ABC-2 type transport system permease protein n=1 Tax=Actinoallomurus acaciae TaxID=502577 RepID=A0ABV5YHV1_9ACTN
MIAVVRYQLSGYLRSVRALHPVLALALLLAIMFSDPVGGTPAEVRQGTMNAIADLAVLVFPICAWAARGLLDTEPDVQRHVSAVTAGRRRALIAGLVSAYVFSVVLALIGPIYLLAEAAGSGLTPQVALSAALLPLSALAATALGALTSRAVIPSTGTSILVLLGGCGLNLIVGMTPLRLLAIPMIDWMRAAGHGPSGLTGAFPELAARTLVWTALALALYVRLRRTRP